ncbi:DUF7507 domain-containing protein, partial [Algoriphagus sp. oki45]|uniref:DUF7507 domain-containing protein n=1 Tax=Algoriphagus sp. oki45 TaxID=3067294 RepID=UPI00403DCC77
MDLVALDKNGNVIPGARKVQIRGYQWNTGIHHQFDNTSQPQHLVVFSPLLFEQNPTSPILPPIYGFQVNDIGQADGKFVFFTNQISAAPDNAGPIFSFTGANNALNIYSNDEINGQVLTNPSSQVSTQIFDTNNVLSTNGGPLVLNVVTGQLDVPPGTPEGIYTFEYEITDLVDGGKDRTTVTVRVVNNTDPDFPQCTPDQYNCTTNNLNFPAVYLSDRLGNPISNKTCEVGNSQEVYIAVQIQQNSNASRFETRLFADLFIGNNPTPIKINSFLGTINSGSGVVVRVLTDSFIWNCGDQLKLENGVVVWKTNNNSVPTKCTDYNKAQSECFGGIFVASPLSADISSTSCFDGTNYTFNYTAIVNGGVKPYTSYQWDFDNNGTIDFTSSGVSASPNATTVYSNTSATQVRVVVVDSQSPPVSITRIENITYPSNHIPMVEVSSPPTCESAFGAITITNPDPNFQYSLTSDFSTLIQNNVASGLPAGSSGRVYARVIGSINCVVSTPYTIGAQPVTPIPPTITPIPPTCTEPTGGFSFVRENGVEYSLDQNFGASSIISGNEVLNLPANSMGSLYARTIGTICVVSSPYTIGGQPATPVAPQVSLTQPTCTEATGSIVVTAITDGMYSKDNGVTFQASNEFTGLAPGTYQIKVKNASGCISAATEAVINPQPSTAPAPTVTNQTICRVGSGTIGYNVTALSGYTLTYYSTATSNDGTTTAPTVSRSVVGTSSVWVTQTKVGECESPRVQVSISVVQCLTDILLTSFCSDDPTASRRWRIRNPNTFAVTVNWTLNNGGAQNGSFVVPANDEIFFDTNTESGANTMIISWVNEAGQIKTATKASCPDRCIATPTYTAVCTDNPTTERVFSISNPNSFSVNVAWAAVGGSGSGSITLAAGSTIDYVLTTTANSVEFTLPSVCGNVKKDTVSTNPQECPKPAIELVKEGEIIIDGPSDCPFAGDIIRYTFSLYNRGNVPLTSIILSDPLFEAPNPVLAFGDPNGDVGEDGILGTTEIWVYTVDYVIAQADIEAGFVENQATVTSLFGQTIVDDLSGTFNDAIPGGNDYKTVVELCKDFALTLDKQVVSGDPYDAVDDVVVYNYVITNSGNVTLAGPFSVTDDKIATIA